MRLFLLALLLQVQVTSADFRQWLQTRDLTSYINYISDDMLYETETTGQWTLPDRMLFSIRGNSYTQNRFYLNGSRVDGRFLAGSMAYVPDMRHTGLTVDVERGVLRLERDSLCPSEVWLEGNIGGIGGISPGTKEMIHLFHTTASERLLKPIEERSHMLGAGRLSASYTLPLRNGQQLYERLYVDAGSRRLVSFDEGGENGYYDAPFYKIQAEGDLPVADSWQQQGWRLGYLYVMQQRPDLYSELGYNRNEVANLKSHLFHLNARRSRRDYDLAASLSYALSDVRHREREFERNIVDQDGEGFDPWYADGDLSEVSASVQLHYPLLEETRRCPRLQLRLEAYNTLLHWQPRSGEWQHRIYCQFEGHPREEWYQYHFESRAFNGAILENLLALDMHKQLSPRIDLRASIGLSEDALLLRQNSLALPSWEAELDMHFHPKAWFDAHILLGRYRSSYTWEQMRLLSPDYLNGTLTGEHRPYRCYGGATGRTRKGLAQPAYAVLDIPLIFRAGERHSFHILSTARLYYHNWYIAPDGEGFVFREQEPVPGGGLFALPLYLSNVVKYQYDGRKVFFSLSWQSYQQSAWTMLGNGAENNSIGSLAYAMAAPGALQNLQDKSISGKLNRTDQDKSFILRLQMGANITENWQLMTNFHFQDGTPITNYIVADGHIEARRVKGINPVNGQFGMRKDAYFNWDIRLRYQGNINTRNQHIDAIGAVPFSVELTGYNLLDFGTEWYEYSFDQYLGKDKGRSALSLTVPRGLMLCLSVGLEKRQ